MRKQHILYIVAITILFSLIITIDNSYINDNNVSALDYSSNVGVGFTFNPTLSVSISPSDLIIDNLIPGNTLDSNSINVSVATNAAYGYTLSANVNDENLVHSNNVDTFSSIATNADLASLDTDNTWGYTSKLSNETVWNNYNGLPSSSNTVLLDTNSTSSDNSNNNSSNSDNTNNVGSIDFKIAAKASNTQPSGEYTGTINFIAITKPTPMNLAESYFAHGKTRYNGYYTMQDMTTEICNDTEVIGEGSQTELIDIRDNKVYWATKLADNHCWMTQNLDLDLDSNRTYTHWDTDLGWTVMDEEAEWRPLKTTPVFQKTITNIDWSTYGSADPGNVFYYSSGTNENDIEYESLSACTVDHHEDCTHYHVGNYYTWQYAVAANDMSNLGTQYDNAPNSVCPANWRLPIATNENKSIREFNKLFYEEKVIENILSSSYTTNGFDIIRARPLYYVRSGYLAHKKYGDFGIVGRYWPSTIENLSFSYTMYFNNFHIYGSATGYYKNSWMHSVRCLAR